MKGKPNFFTYLEVKNRSKRNNENLIAQNPPIISGLRFKDFYYCLAENPNFEYISSEMEQAGDVPFRKWTQQVKLSKDVIEQQWLMGLLTTLNTSRQCLGFSFKPTCKLLKHHLFSEHGFQIVLNCLELKAPVDLERVMKDSDFGFEVASCLLNRYMEFLFFDQDELVISKHWFNLQSCYAHLSILQIHLLLKILKYTTQDDIPKDWTDLRTVLQQLRTSSVLDQEFKLDSKVIPADKRHVDYFDGNVIQSLRKCSVLFLNAIKTL